MFARNVSFALVRIGFAACLSLFVSSYLARVLGPEVNGVYTLAILLPITAFSFGNLGVGSSSVYFISKKIFSLKDVVSSNILLGGCSGAVLLFLLIGAVVFFGDSWFLGIPFHVLCVSIFAVFPLIIFNNLASVFQGLLNFKLHGMLAITPLAITSIFLLSALWLFDDLAFGAVFFWAVGYFVACLIVVFLLRREIDVGHSLSRNQAPVCREMLRYGLVAHLSNVITFLNYRVDVYLLGIISGAASVGLYAVTVPITEATWMISTAVSAVIFPFVSSRENGGGSNSITPQVSRFVFLATLIVSIFIASCSGWIISVFFGDAYSKSQLALLCLLPGVTLWSVARVLCNDIAGRGKPHVNLVVSFFALLVNFVANLVLIPMYDVIGAALASSISYSFFAIVVAVVYSRISSSSVLSLFVLKKADVVLVLSLINLKQSEVRSGKRK